MNKGLEKRRQIFDRFSGQLLLLKQQGIINLDFEYERPYICPICLIQFSDTDIAETTNGNYLTLEDAPPDALGGSKIALTCKKCNSECGHKIDFHLIEMLREIDRSFFHAGSVHHGYVEHNGERVTVEITSNGSGELIAKHAFKQNNPNTLDRFIYGIKTKSLGTILNFKPPPSRVNIDKVGYALLKASYIITFAKFGYIFLLDPRYDIIRKQLLNPDTLVFNTSLFAKVPFSKSNVGTYYVHNPEMRSILNVFSLETEYSEMVIVGLLPVPTISYEQMEVQMRPGGQPAMLEMNATNYDPNADLFTDITQINVVRNWINAV